MRNDRVAAHNSRPSGAVKRSAGLLAAAAATLLSSCARVQPQDGPADIPAAAIWSDAQLVIVVTTEYRFTPDHLGFRPGGRYRLRLENPGAELHEFTAPAFFAAIDLANPDILVAGGHEVVLRPKERKELYFVARRQGRYRLTCADHDWAGMVGEIVIE
jgi:uncharacterized cupredoxin-like copper-binding protein